MGGFVVLDADGVEIIQVGLYYSARHTNNKADSFALWDALQCLMKFF